MDDRSSRSCLHFLVSEFPAPPDVLALCMPLPVANYAPGMNRRTVAGVHGFATTTAYLWCWHFHLLPGRTLDSIGTSSRDVNPPLPGRQCWHLRQVRTGTPPRFYSTISASEVPLIPGRLALHHSPGTAPRSQVVSLDLFLAVITEHSLLTAHARRIDKL